MTDQPAPRVSAIIPARNEELNIGQAVASVAAQRDIREIIVVDDESQDETPQRLAELRQRYTNLRTLRLHDLPEGWLGKTRALAEGAKLATGEWLLFTDADTVHYAGSLAALLEKAEEQRADLLSISPGQRVGAWWERAVIPLIYAELARLFPFEAVSDVRSGAAAANGQYLLVRRSVYDFVGGWQAVRDAVLDDVAFAQRIKSEGGRILFLPGAAWAETRMYRQFGEMWRGWTKNLYLLYGRDAGKMGRAAARFMLYGFIPFVMFALFSALFALDFGSRLSDGCLAIFFAAASAASLREYRRSIAKLGFRARLWRYLPLGAPLAALILLNSLRVYCRGGSIEWKGRSYPVKGTL